MNQRWLGILAMLGAPFLFIDFLVHGFGGYDTSTRLSGVFGFIYISAWLCSIVGLWYARATGNNQWGRLTLVLQMTFLLLADVSNIMTVIQPGIHATYFIALDMFWPISNVWMIATAVTVFRAKQMHGWARKIPLFVCLWLPVSLVVMQLLGKTEATLWITGLYSTVAWALLGVVVFRSNATATFSKLSMAS